MHNRQLGVIREDPVDDMRLLIQNYTGKTFNCVSTFLRQRFQTFPYRSSQTTSF